MLAFFLSLCLLAVGTDSFMYQPSRGLAPLRTIQTQHLAWKTLFPRQTKSFNLYAGDAYSICVLVDGDGDEDTDRFREDALRVAERLGVPLWNESAREGSPGENFSHALRLVPYDYNAELSTFALGIEPMVEDKTRRNKRKPKRNKPSQVFFVDLFPPPNSKAGRRTSGASGTGDLLVKAVGPCRGGNSLAVWDLTAGLGQDALVLAKSGAKCVHMVERNPIVAALLEDAMRRLELLAVKTGENDGSNPARALRETLRLSIGDGTKVLKKENSEDSCDVVYLDPMFPPRQKQSAVKKGMSVLHGLLETHLKESSDSDHRQRLEEEQKLLETALDAARLRVVVKRPVKAPLLGDGSAKPSHVLTGSINRWDVYVKPKPHSEPTG